eukprot:TRINITY_DN650_c0_g1_i1.p1 TRINITY_DN650_c0_g1~~TRINITY_DN650_c0_g1_i1.p1  ORF type:complete len:831 (+),score=385.44 TRINITY_DN650_c0_g1_i1:59-2551(+)
MSRLRDFIKTIRQCKTAAEERTVISRECAAIRSDIREDENDIRQRNVAKLLYIHMLGHPTHFAQMECLKLIVSPHFSDKRMGYLGLMLLLDERQEVLMLVTNSLKNDLNHPNQYVVGLALCSLANLATPGMARDLSPDVIKLLSSYNPYIRKKAILCAIRIIRKASDLMENYVSRIRTLLTERNHAVLFTTITLMNQLCDIDNTNILVFRKLCPVLVRIMKNLILSGYAPEHDVGGITDPFLQVKVLRLLRIVSIGDSEASESLNDVLAQVATNTDGSRNVGNAILYESVQTIMSIDSEPGLRVLAINILGRFLLNRDNNIRYVALHTLAQVVTIDPQPIQRHRTTIVDCLKDHDVSIRRRALDLVYALVNETNIKILVRELINFMNSADSEFRDELAVKIATVTERFAPSKIWHFDTILRVLLISENVPEQVINNLIGLISRTQELQLYSAQKLYLALQQTIIKQPLTQLAIWAIAEYADLLVANPILPSSDSDVDIVLPIDKPINVFESSIVDLYERVLHYPTTILATKEFIFTGFVKFATRFKDEVQINRIQNILNPYRASITLELQQRACEYLSIFTTLPTNTRQTLLAKMPPIEEKEQIIPVTTQRRIVEEVSLPTTIIAPTTPVLKSTSTGINLLDDLLGNTTPTVASSQSKSSTTTLEDLLGLTSIPTVTTPTQSNTLNLTNLIPNMSTTPSTVPASTSNAANPTSTQTITAYQKDGLTIVFDLIQHPTNPSFAIINAKFTNSTPITFTNFSFQAAVPKYARIQLAPPSSDVISPNATIVQQIKTANSAQGEKPLALKIRVSYLMNGQQVNESADIFNFPPGF